MKTGIGKPDWLMPVFGGMTVMFVLSVALTAMCAALIQRGVVPVRGMTAAAYGIAVIAALAGSLCCGTFAKRAKLPLCMGAAAMFLLCAFVLRGLVFKTAGQQPWIIPLCVLIGAIAGALIANLKKHR